jgi:hypothetical protein
LTAAFFYFSLYIRGLKISWILAFLPGWNFKGQANFFNPYKAGWEK